MFSWLTAILEFFNGIVDIFRKYLDSKKSDELIDQGKELQNADLAKKEIESVREQTEILTKDVSKEDLIKQLESGEF